MNRSAIPASLNETATVQEPPRLRTPWPKDPTCLSQVVCSRAEAPDPILTISARLKDVGSNALQAVTEQTAINHSSLGEIRQFRFFMSRLSHTFHVRPMSGI
jgi:hypothetical protein